MLRKTRTSEGLYFEWAPKTEARLGTMVPLSAMSRLLAERDPGFRSVYMFDKAAATAIKAAGSSKDFKQYAVSAQELFIDLDHGEQQLLEVEAKLNGLRYEVWVSGGKGFHIVLPTELLEGTDVPEAHAQWVKTLGVKVDMSLYRPSSLIALPGRIHPRTGLKKTLLRRVPGKLLHIPDPVHVESAPQYPTADIPELSMLFIRLANMAAIEPEQGWRHTSLWSMASSLRDAGIGEDATLSILIKVNESWTSPKTESEVVRAVSQAFQT